MQIEGIPEGWLPVAMRKAEPSEPILDDSGKVAFWAGKAKSHRVFLILKKIEKPKRFRPFANAAEYMPNWGKPVCYKDKASSFSLSSVNFAGNLSVYIAFGDTVRKMKYQEAFDMLVFADGTPFGVEVTE